ncbi:unnamed protein product [Urochloa humidicola]
MKGTCSGSQPYPAAVLFAMVINMESMRRRKSLVKFRQLQFQLAGWIPSSHEERQVLYESVKTQPIPCGILSSLVHGQ